MPKHAVSFAEPAAIEHRGSYQGAEVKSVDRMENDQ
jgi:hypothetical protein